MTAQPMYWDGVEPVLETIHVQLFEHQPGAESLNGLESTFGYPDAYPPPRARGSYTQSNTIPATPPPSPPQDTAMTGGIGATTAGTSPKPPQTYGHGIDMPSMPPQSISIPVTTVPKPCGKSAVPHQYSGAQANNPQVSQTLTSAVATPSMSSPETTILDERNNSQAGNPMLSRIHNRMALTTSLSSEHPPLPGMPSNSHAETSMQSPSMAFQALNSVAARPSVPSDLASLVDKGSNAKPDTSNLLQTYNSVATTLSMPSEVPSEVSSEAAPTSEKAHNTQTNTPAPCTQAPPPLNSKQSKWKGRKLKNINYLNDKWNGNSWYPGRFLKANHGTAPAQMNDNDVQYLRAITKAALNRRIPLQSLYQPGGAIYDAMADLNGGIPRWTWKTAKAAKALLDRRFAGESSRESEEVTWTEPDMTHSMTPSTASTWKASAPYGAGGTQPSGLKPSRTQGMGLTTASTMRLGVAPASGVTMSQGTALVTPLARPSAPPPATEPCTRPDILAAATTRTSSTGPTTRPASSSTSGPSTQPSTAPNSGRSSAATPSKTASHPAALGLLYQPAIDFAGRVTGAASNSDLNGRQHTVMTSPRGHRPQVEKTDILSMNSHHNSPDRVKHSMDLDTSKAQSPVSSPVSSSNMPRNYANRPSSSREVGTSHQSAMIPPGTRSTSLHQVALQASQVATPRPLLGAASTKQTGNESIADAGTQGGFLDGEDVYNASPRLPHATTGRVRAAPSFGHGQTVSDCAIPPTACFQDVLQPAQVLAPRSLPEISTQDHPAACGMLDFQRCYQTNVPSVAHPSRLGGSHADQKRTPAQVYRPHRAQDLTGNQPVSGKDIASPYAATVGIMQSSAGSSMQSQTALLPGTRVEPTVLPASTVAGQIANTALLTAKRKRDVHDEDQRQAAARSSSESDIARWVEEAAKVFQQRLLDGEGAVGHSAMQLETDDFIVTMTPKPPSCRNCITSRSETSSSLASVPHAAAPDEGGRSQTRAGDPTAVPNYERLLANLNLLATHFSQHPPRPRRVIAEELFSYEASLQALQTARQTAVTNEASANAASNQLCSQIDHRVRIRNETHAKLNGVMVELMATGLEQQQLDSIRGHLDSSKLNQQREVDDATTKLEEALSALGRASTERRRIDEEVNSMEEKTPYLEKELRLVEEFSKFMEQCKAQGLGAEMQPPSGPGKRGSDIARAA